MIDYSAGIGERMRELVLRWFTAEPLAKSALSYLEAKLTESFKFSQLTVIHYNMFEGKSGDVYQAAAAVELFVLASDILDDLQDGDAPDKIWMQSPQPIAIHVATSLLALSQQAMLESTLESKHQLSLSRMMNNQLLQAANGQMLDLVNEIQDEQSYLSMVQQKSAALLVLACMTGVMLAGHDWHPIVAEYAQELGIAAQIRNDIRDLLRWDDKGDFLNRKKNLLTLYLVEGAEEQDRWIADYFEGRLSSAEVSDNQALFRDACERTGAILYGSVMSRMHYNRFEELLDDLEVSSSWKGLLLQSQSQEIA